MSKPTPPVEPPYKDQLYCLYGSILGAPDDPSPRALNNFVDTMRDIYLAEIVVYYLMTASISAYMIFVCYRKTKMSSFQWTLMSLTLFNCTFTIVDMHLYIGKISFVCSFWNNFVLGFQYISFFLQVYMCAWKIYTISSDIAEFVLHKQLPSEAKKKRNTRLYISMFVVSIFLWIFYSTFISFLYANAKSNFIVNFNFAFRIVLSVFLMLSIGMFLLSYVRISKVLKVSAIRRNSSFLSKARLAMGCFLLGCICNTLLELFELYTQGYFGTTALVSNGANEVYYCLVNILFISVALLGANFTLKTKVLANGDVLIVGVDDNERESFKIYIDEQPKGGEDEHEVILNQWRIVDNRSSMDDITSDGGQTSITASPLGSQAAGFVSTFDNTASPMHGAAPAGFSINGLPGFGDNNTFELEQPLSQRNRESGKVDFETGMSATPKDDSSLFQNSN